MKATQSVFFSIFLLFAVQSAQSQSGISDKINADPERAQSVNSLERDAEKAVANGDDYTAMVY